MLKRLSVLGGLHEIECDWMMMVMWVPDSPVIHLPDCGMLSCVTVTVREVGCQT
jgi:hypothetical protein